MNWKNFLKIQKILRGISRGGFESHALPPPRSAPIFRIVKQFWIFWQLIFLNFLTIAYSYIVYSRFSDSAKISRTLHFWKNLPFPCSSRTLVHALVHESKNVCLRWNVRPFFSTGWSGLYTIFKAHVVENFYQKITW